MRRRERDEEEGEKEEKEEEERGWNTYLFQWITKKKRAYRPYLINVAMTFKMAEFSIRNQDSGSW